MNVNDFDLLRTGSDDATCWIEAAPDLTTAKHRAQQLASIHLGQFIVVFSQRQQRVILTLESDAHITVQAT